MYSTLGLGSSFCFYLRSNQGRSSPLSRPLFPPLQNPLCSRRHPPKWYLGKCALMVRFRHWGRSWGGGTLPNTTPSHIHVHTHAHTQKHACTCTNVQTCTDGSRLCVLEADLGGVELNFIIDCRGHIIMCKCHDHLWRHILVPCAGEDPEASGDAVTCPPSPS